MKLVLTLALTALVTATAACSDGPRSSRPVTDAQATEYRPVRFVAADGVELIGRLSGTGDVGVILAHGFSPGTAQDGWLRFVPALVSRGYTVLTFNFRGFCDSKGKCSAGVVKVGNNWRDTVAAVRFMETRGAKQIFLVGASMGGIAVLRAARMPDMNVAGVVSLATPQWPSKYYDILESPANDVTPTRLRQIDEPKLFVAGTNDVQLLPGSAARSVRFAADAQLMFDAAEEPKELALVDSSFHSSGLVTTAPPDVVERTSGVIFDFLSENS